jgi:predicted O-methyltransferase YrrM
MLPEPRYTRDWTSHHFADWQRWLGHLVDQPETGLEIGSFEGRSARWFVENILTSTQSELLCIDPYDYADERAAIPGGATHIDDMFDWRLIRETFEHNLFPWTEQGRVVLDASPSRDALRRLPNWDLYAFAFIDGSHAASAVLEDSILVWPRLKPGGILIWDDYTWTQSKPHPKPHLVRPKLAIDTFLQVYDTQYADLEFSNDQAKVRRVR